LARGIAVERLSWGLQVQLIQSTSSRKRVRYRYRWPDEVRDEVLARLLELNRQRAEEERRLAVEEERAARRGRGRRARGAGPPVLF
jgi:hypothetical protein